MGMSSSEVEERTPGRLALPSLVVSGFATKPARILVTLLLIEIAQTFGHTVGAIGQIQTLSSSIEIVSALLMGALSIRFKHKALLMIGLGFLGLSALGCYAAVSLRMMLIAYALTGLGTAMTLPMAITLVGEHLPLDRRSSAIGMISAGMSVSYVVSPSLINYVSDLSGWRYACLVYVLPIPVIGLLIAALGLPTEPRNSNWVGVGGYVEGFREVFTRRSASACVVGTILALAAWQGIVFYGISFFRSRYLVSSGWGSLVLSSLALIFTLGTLWSGRLVNRFGRKPFTVLTILLLSIFTIAYTNLPDIWLSLGAAHLGSFFAGLMYTAANSLALEQVPSFRGTMMSINAAAIGMGVALGSAVGGMALQRFDWEVLGISLGLLGLAAAATYCLLAVDPTRT
jgi:DHA1 family inner membrane transport protein